MTENDTTPAASTDQSATPSRRPGLRKAFGVIAVIHVVLIVLQPILAGLSLQGSMVALDAHVMNGMVIMTVAVIQIIAAAVWMAAGGGPSRALGVSVFVLLLEVVQFAVGDAGSYAIHLPLGIVLLAGAGMVPRMAFGSAGPRRSRRARKSSQQAPMAEGQ